MILPAVQLAATTAFKRAAFDTARNDALLWLTGGLSAPLSPKGNRVEAFGRGSAMALGGGLGSLPGSLIGSGVTGALGGGDTAQLGGSLAGAAAGTLAGVLGTRALIGRSSWAEEEERKKREEEAALQQVSIKSSAFQPRPEPTGLPPTGSPVYPLSAPNVERVAYLNKMLRDNGHESRVAGMERPEATYPAPVASTGMSGLLAKVRGKSGVTRPEATYPTSAAGTGISGLLSKARSNPGLALAGAAGTAAAVGAVGLGAYGLTRALRTKKKPTLKMAGLLGTVAKNVALPVKIGGGVAGGGAALTEYLNRRAPSIGKGLGAAAASEVQPAVSEAMGQAQRLSDSTLAGVDQRLNRVDQTVGQLPHSMAGALKQQMAQSTLAHPGVIVGGGLVAGGLLGGALGGRNEKGKRRLLPWLMGAGVGGLGAAGYLAHLRHQQAAGGAA